MPTRGWALTVISVTNPSKHFSTSSSNSITQHLLLNWQPKGRLCQGMCSANSRKPSNAAVLSMVSCGCVARLVMLNIWWRSVANAVVSVPAVGPARLVESAALLVDEVLPYEPMRQWVLSFPFQLRFLFARHPEIMSQVLGIVYRAIATHLTHKAGYTKTTAQTGAVTLIQRFGSALNLNIHLMCMDARMPRMRKSGAHAVP